MFVRSRREFLKDTLRSVTALGAVGSLANRAVKIARSVLLEYR